VQEIGPAMVQCASAGHGGRPAVRNGQVRRIVVELR
jgi:hypothetical protein